MLKLQIMRVRGHLDLLPFLNGKPEWEKFLLQKDENSNSIPEDKK